MDKNLLQEAQAFDRQILERVEHGHIPDLRYTQKCEYFYNNVWRHPDFVQLDFGEIFKIIRNAIQKFIIKSEVHVLEVGSGPGFISLELARNGFNVTGIELSPYCTEVAKRFADSDPDKEHRGVLEFIEGDFFSNKDFTKKFDVVVFVGALHHFPDQELCLSRAEELLNPGGIIIAHEPTRDRVEKKNASIFQFVKSLMALSGGYYQKAGPYQSVEEIDKDVEAAYIKMRYETEEGEKAQSVNDNASGYHQMVPALRNRFIELDYQERYAFFHELIGGLRFSDEMNREIANTIKLFDKYLCETGVIQPAEFFFVGRKKNV